MVATGLTKPFHPNSTATAKLLTAKAVDVRIHLILAEGPFLLWNSMQRYTS